jgi:dihydroorotate dehydrogenase (fumarate)
MDRKGYESLDQFRGKLSEQNHEDRFAYRRAQYVKMLLRSDEFLRRPNLI